MYLPSCLKLLEYNVSSEKSFYGGNQIKKEGRKEKDLIQIF